MLFRLNEFELLRAANDISLRWGGTHVGTVGDVAITVNDDKAELWTGQSYRNQWLIAVEFQDEEDSSLFAPGVTAYGRHCWTLRCGFCQTQIQRAPRGGFELKLDPELLALCGSVDDVVALWQCQLGDGVTRAERLLMWYKRMRSELLAMPAGIWDMSSIVREDALAYAEEWPGVIT